MDVMYALVNNIIDTNYEKLPGEVVEATKRLIMDSLTFWRLICCISAPFIASGMIFFMCLVKYWAEIYDEGHES